MRFQDKLKKYSRRELWQAYCGFLDLSLEEYMGIQRRLLHEQLAVWCASGLGKELLHGAEARSIEDLRRLLPLTKYEDYADVLLAKRADLLPSEPVVWLQTTWEGGTRPIKLAPYSRAMLDCYKHNILAVTMLASGGPEDVGIRKGDRVLYGGAPLPYVTGLLPSVLDEDIKLCWLPDTNEHSRLSFSGRIKKGFEMAFGGGLDYFFAIGSVANYITEHFGDMSGKSGGGILRRVTPGIALRYLRAKYCCRRDGRKMRPADVFQLKGMVCTGTDAHCYRESLAKAWGVEPVEIAAGTESTCLAAEGRGKQGMVFFPDACFYEFIPRADMLRSLWNPDYVPRTCLMDEVRAGEDYELVISVLHGGAFMRYRIGDVYRCLSSGVGLPRFTYLDRIPTVIDIAGFTRITEGTVGEVLRLSRQGVGQWLARKEFDGRGYPFLHMYAEILPEAQLNDVTRTDVLRDAMSVFFRYYDSDYGDLKKLLDMEPLQITILPYGCFDRFQQKNGRAIRRINPDPLDVAALVRDGAGEEAAV